jgi:GxxExxY protein
MDPDSPEFGKADAEDAENTERADLRGKTSLLYGDISGAILGAFYSVYSELGSGFLEAVYANALTVLLLRAGLRVEREVPFEIVFHGQSIGRYRADMVVESRIVVEIKAGRCIIPQHTAQLLNYLRASQLNVGLLLNFGDTAEFKRVVWTRNPPR